MPNFYLPHKRVKVARHAGRPCASRWTACPRFAASTADLNSAAIPPKDRRNLSRNLARGMRAKNGSPEESVQELKMTAFKGWAISVGLMLAATAAPTQASYQ